MTPQEAIARMEAMIRHEQWKVDHIHDAPAIRGRAIKDIEALQKGIAGLQLIMARDTRTSPRPLISRYEVAQTSREDTETIRTE